MKTAASLMIVIALTWNVVCAQNLTEANVARVNEVLAAAVEAHGGEDKMNALNTLIIEIDSIDYLVDQSRGTEAPWDTLRRWGVSAIDVENTTFATRFRSESSSFEGHNGTVINADNSFQMDFRRGTATKIEAADFAAASGPMVRVTPVLLLKNLQQRASNAHYMGEATIDEIDYEVIAFSMTVGPALTLYFDKQQHLLRRSERMIPGLGLVEYEFLKYEDVDGIPVNKEFRLYLNGELNIVRNNIKSTINAPIADHLTVDSNLIELELLPPEDLTRQEVAEGVWLIGGSGTYAMFVDMGDYIFAAGGTAGIPDRIASLREVVGDKPIRYGMMTHHHADHVVGVPAYEEEGAAIIAAAAHEKIVRAAAENGRKLKIKKVKDDMTLEADGRTVEIIDIGPTAHSEHLLVAYLPKEGILFEADHFSLPRNGPPRVAVPSTESFAEALRTRELAVQKILSAHSPRVATMDDLTEALQAEAYQAKN